MKKIVIAALFGVTAGTLQAQVPRDSAAITRQQAIAQALAHNPQLDVAQEQTAQARARVSEATALPDPGISGSFDDLSGPTRFGTRGGHTIGADLAIPFPDKIRLAGAVAKAGV